MNTPIIEWLNKNAADKYEPHKCFGDYFFTRWYFTGCIIEMRSKDKGECFHLIKTNCYWREGYGIIHHSFGAEQKVTTLKELQKFIKHRAVRIYLFDIFINICLILGISLILLSIYKFFCN